MIVGRVKPETKRMIFEPGIFEGKVPPHDLDAEAAVISACMLAERSALSECADILSPDAFYSEAHARIFEAIIECDQAGTPIDAVTVATRLKDKQRLAQVGGMPYLVHVLDSAPAIANVRAYAVTVIDLWRLRQAILSCLQFAARGYGPRQDTAAAVAELEAELSKITGDHAQNRTAPIAQLLKDVYDRLVKSYTDHRPPGIATGFGSFDDLTAGLHRKDLTLIAARPGMGKTSFMIALAINVSGCAPLLLSDDGQPWQEQGISFFSLEMPREQIGQRAIAVDSVVSAQRMRTGRLDEADWGPITWSCQRLAKLPLRVDDTSGLSITAAVTRVRREKAEWKKRGARMTIAIFDYLQLMRGDGTARSREEEIGQISRGLKGLAKDEDLAVIAGCQLNRALESRSGADKRPRIADLRESGNLEQDADNVVFIHRPSVYGEKDPEGEDGRTELIVAKQRSGPTGTAVCKYVPGSTRFEPMPGY